MAEEKPDAAARCQRTTALRAVTAERAEGSDHEAKATHQPIWERPRVEVISLLLFPLALIMA